MTKKEHQEIINNIKNQIEEKAYRTNNNIESYFVDFDGLAILEELHTIVKDLSFCTTGIHRGVIHSTKWSVCWRI